MDTILQLEEWLGIHISDENIVVCSCETLEIGKCQSWGYCVACIGLLESI